MRSAEKQTQCKVYAPEADAFRHVPASTRDLWVNLLTPSKASELASLGHRLGQLERLVLMNGQVENLDFLCSFSGIQSLSCLTPSLRDIGGLVHCVGLRRLHMGATFSSSPDLRVLGHLSQLEELRLEGPKPRKGLEEAGSLSSIKSLNLYAPKWSLEHLPKVFPGVEDLTISQGAYRSLDFIASLDQLTKLDISYARKLTGFDAVGRHRHLRRLMIGHAITNFQSCSQFGASATVEQIKISACKQLRDISALADWPALREATIYDCPLIAPAQIEQLRRRGKKANGK